MSDRPISKRYLLGEQYPGVYFTQREAECMVLLMEGNTYSQISEKLSLSIRTIEYYCTNMCCKLKCKTNTELIVKTQATYFMNYVSSISEELVNLKAR